MTPKEAAESKSRQDRRPTTCGASARVVYCCLYCVRTNVSAQQRSNRQAMSTQRHHQAKEANFLVFFGNGSRSGEMSSAPLLVPVANRASTGTRRHGSGNRSRRPTLGSLRAVALHRRVAPFYQRQTRSCSTRARGPILFHNEHYRPKRMRSLELGNWEMAFESGSFRAPTTIPFPAVCSASAWTGAEGHGTS